MSIRQTIKDIRKADRERRLEAMRDGRIETSHRFVDRKKQGSKRARRKGKHRNQRDE